MMGKTRIQVYTDEETKRRIELAAARQDIAVTQYCLEAIKQQLAEDDMLERETIEIPIKPTRDEELIADLRALHEEIKAYRGGKFIDVDQELEQMREARDDELTGLR
jgi:hypothetical protein